MPTVNVRYMADDVEAAVAFYTTQLDFALISKTLPAFADVVRGDLRLLLSGPASSAGRPMPDGRRPVPGGWNRIHLIVDDLEAEVARLRSARAFPQRGPDWPGRVSDPAGRPVRQSDRVVPAPAYVTSCLETLGYPGKSRCSAGVSSVLPRIGRRYSTNASTYPCSSWVSSR